MSKNRRSIGAGAWKEIIWEQQLEGEGEPGQGLSREGDGPGEEIMEVEMSQRSPAKEEERGMSSGEAAHTRRTWGWAGGAAPVPCAGQELARGSWRRIRAGQSGQAGAGSCWKLPGNRDTQPCPPRSCLLSAGPR